MHLRPLIEPESSTFTELARATWNERSDLQEAYADPGSEEFDRWIAVNGLLEYPARFGRYYPPVPPEALRETACGGKEAHTHLYSGLEDLAVVVDTFETFAQKPIQTVESLLDFGSGCGRLLRWFDRGLPTAALCGVDVRAASVEWSQKNLRGDHIAGPYDPPTDLPEDAFDLVVSLSVFSHLTRESNIAWVRELARVCKPGGLMILTTHGALSLAAIAEGAEYQRAFFLSEAEARELLRTLSANEFHYHQPPTAWQQSIEVGENYGQAFMNEAFAAREWSPYAELLGCIPARLFRFQDVYVLRARS